MSLPQQIWVGHTGHEMPVAPDVLVMYRVEGGGDDVFVDKAGDLYWGPGLGDDNLGRILEYAEVLGANR